MHAKGCISGGRMADYEKGVQSFDGAGRIQLMGFSAMTAEAAVTVTGPITETEITGNSDTGTASGNTLNVTDASLDSTGIRIYGGTVSGGESGDASNNTVNVTNTQVSQAEIYGGQSRLGATNNNTVIFDSSSTAAAVYGPMAIRLQETMWKAQEPVIFYTWADLIQTILGTLCLLQEDQYSIRCPGVRRIMVRRQIILLKLEMVHLV